MSRCPKPSRLEAARDGRLAARAHAAVVAHQRRCERCQAQTDALAGLGRVLAKLPAPATDALAVRRQRNRLLASFDGARPAPPRRWRWAIAVAGGVAIAAAVIVQLAAPPARGLGADVAVVATGARWSRHDERGLTLVRLDDGELELRVSHGAAPHHLIVSLPDAELEDLGTTFHVRVAAGRTASIEVRDGAVVMRRAGSVPVFLTAGDRWTAPPVTVAPPPVAPAPPAPPPVVVAPPPVAPAPPVPGPRTPAGNPAAAEFRAAVALLDAGRSAEAAAALRAFVARRAGDRHAEDAGYLLVLALQRAADPAMRDAAHDYLRRYPSGFRRAQVDSLLRGAP